MFRRPETTGLRGTDTDVRKNARAGYENPLGSQSGRGPLDRVAGPR